MNYYGVFDIGSNSVKLYVFALNGFKATLEFANESFLKLYAYIKNGVFLPSGYKLLTDFINTQIKITQAKFKNISFLGYATQYFREINNQLLLTQLKDKFNLIKFVILDAHDEALANFTTWANSTKQSTLSINAPVALVDIGGGSTEIVIVKNNQPALVHSCPHLGVRSILQSSFVKKVQLDFIKNHVNSLIKFLTLKYFKNNQPVNFNSVLFGNGGSFDATFQIYYDLKNLVDMPTKLSLLNCQEINQKIANFALNDYLIFSHFNQKRADVFYLALAIIINLLQAWKIDFVQLIKKPIALGFLIAHLKAK